jgi:class I fructose-bisphosphate aldolase
MAVDYAKIQTLLGAEADQLLGYTSNTISKENLQLPGADFVDRVWAQSDRSPAVLRSMQTLYDTGNLRGTGYL